MRGRPAHVVRPALPLSPSDQLSRRCRPLLMSDAHVTSALRPGGPGRSGPARRGAHQRAGVNASLITFAQRGRAWVASTGRSRSSPAPDAGSGAPRRCCSPPRVRRWSSTTSAARPRVRAPTSDPAQQVVDEITAAGGRAAANYDDIATWSGGQALVAQAVDTFGGLDVRRQQRRDPPGQDELQHGRGRVGRGHRRPPQGPLHDESVRRVVLAPEVARTPAAPVGAAIVNTASESGLYGNAGQANYAAAKAGIASMTIVMARELERIGARVERDRARGPDPAHRGRRRRDDGRRRKVTSTASPPRTPPRWRCGSRRPTPPASTARSSRSGREGAAARRVATAHRGAGRRRLDARLAERRERDALTSGRPTTRAAVHAAGRG